MFQQGDTHTPAHRNRTNPQLTYKNLIHIAWTYAINEQETNGYWEFDEPVPRYECGCVDCTVYHKRKHETKATSKMLFWLAEKVVYMKTYKIRAMDICRRYSNLQFHLFHFEEAFDLVLKKFNELL